MLLYVAVWLNAYDDDDDDGKQYNVIAYMGMYLDQYVD